MLVTHSKHICQYSNTIHWAQLEHQGGPTRYTLAGSSGAVRHDTLWPGAAGRSDTIHSGREQRGGPTRYTPAGSSGAVQHDTLRPGAAGRSDTIHSGREQRGGPTRYTPAGSSGAVRHDTLRPGAAGRSDTIHSGREQRGGPTRYTLAGSTYQGGPTRYTLAGSSGAVRHDTLWPGARTRVVRHDTRSCNLPQSYLEIPSHTYGLLYHHFSQLDIFRHTCSTVCDHHCCHDNSLKWKTVWTLTFQNNTGYAGSLDNRHTAIHSQQSYLKGYYLQYTLAHEI